MIQAVMGICRRLLLSILSLLLVLPLAATVRPAAQPTDRQNASPSPSLSRVIERAEDLRRHWHLEEAELAYRDILNHDHVNERALLGLANIEETKYNYTAARSYLERAYTPAQPDAQVLIGLGDLYLSVEEPERAAGYFMQALKRAPKDPAALIGTARVGFLHREFPSAKKITQNLLSADNTNVLARETLARIEMEENQNQEAAKDAQLVLQQEPDNVNALLTLCLVQVAERKQQKGEEVRRLARQVLELNPYNISARRILSQYINSKKGYAQMVKPPALARFERGQQLRAEGRLNDSLAEYKVALEVEPDYYRALLAMGAIYLTLNDYESAIITAKRCIAIDPEGSLGQLQLSQAYSLMQETERLNIGAVNFRTRFANRTVTKLPGVADVFISYNSLTPEQQQVIDISIAPLAQYVPELARHDGKHYLLALDARLAEVRSDLEDRLTFDGRYYSSVRGVGGLITASGVEYLDAAARGDFNTIAHEFAHQIHTVVFDEKMVRRISLLYTRAKNRERTLDYYAAENEYEYFAQGYEAYVSLFKRPSAGVTARHTREELRQRDPELYQLIDELAAQSPIKVTVNAAPLH